MTTGCMGNGAAGSGAKVYGYELAGRYCGGVEGNVKKGTLFWTRHGYELKFCEVCQESRCGRIVVGGTTCEGWSW